MPFRLPTLYCGWGFPGGASGKEPPAKAGDSGLIPGSDTKRHRFDPWVGKMEKGMATHSSILAWRIPWTEEPGGL